MSVIIHRRRLLKAGVAASVVAGSQIFAGIPALADYAVGPTVRRNASTMLASDPILRGYRRAIIRMRGLPDTNPCSWLYQAAIHGTNDPRNLEAWNSCHLDPTFFWAWHRMYLYWFERIVRKYSGMYDWAIPYWDWTNSGQRALPAPFRVFGNTLFDSTRNGLVNSGSLLSTGLATSVTNAMTSADYFNTQSAINGPHGSVHISVGGNMTQFETAALDPIFWVHHSQVDRLWNIWLAQGGGRSSPVQNSTWRNTTYTFFDECCQKVTMKGCDIVRAARQLSYGYEGEPPQVAQYCPIVAIDINSVERIAFFPRTHQLLKATSRVPLSLPPRLKSANKLSSVMRSTERHPVLQLRGVEAPSQPGVSWEVHVGPKGFVPGERSLVGIFALFSGGLKDRKGHYHPADFDFPVRRALAGAITETPEVVFIPVSGLEGDAAAATKAAEPKTLVTVREIAIIAEVAAQGLAPEVQEILRRKESDE